jgi:hypothetical protein
MWYRTRLAPGGACLHGVRLATALFLAATPGALRAADPDLVWQIGTLDGSPGEFALGAKEDYASFSKRFGDEVPFALGASDVGRDFPYIHPGPMDVWAGARAHTVRVAFALPGEPAGTYLLLVGLCRSHYAYPPVLEVRIGGEKVGEVSTEKDGHRQQAYLLIPPARLRPGTNEIRISNSNGSWAVYDALRLERHPPGAVVERIESLGLRDTPYLIDRGGALRQVIQARVRGLWDGKGTFAVRGPGVEMQVGAEEVRVGQGLYELPIPAPEKPVSYSCALIMGGGGRSEGVVEVTPHRRWTVYAALKTHYDLGYTHPVDQMLRDAAGPMLEKILEYCNATRDFPPENRFRWTYPTWVLGKIRELQPEAGLARFDAAVREGAIGWNAAPFTLHSYFCGIEDMVRAFYPAADLERRYGRAVRWAKQTDVPGHTRFLPQVLARSGIRLLQIGANNGVRGVQAPLLFRWEGPDGSRVLTQLTPGYGWGFDEDLLLRLERDPAYPYDAFLALYVTGDNVGPADLVEVAKLAKRIGERYAWPRFRIGPVDEFVDAIDARFADKVPVVRTELTDWWIHGVASMAREVAIARRSRELLPAAEKAWALAGLAGATAPYPAARFAEGYIQSLLFSEHTWGMAGFKPKPQPPASRDLETNSSEDYRQMRRSWEVKGDEARAADRIATETAQTGLAALAAAVSPAHNRGPAFLVFNPLNWTRTDWVRIPRTEAGPDPGQVLDAATGEPVPFQIDGPDLTILARDVPPVGYAVFSAGHAPPGANNPPAQPSAAGVVENARYRVTFDPKAGAVRSIVDRETGQELVDPGAPFLLGQYVYEGMAKVEGAGWHGSPWEGPGTGKVVPTIASTRIERGALFTRFVAEGTLPIAGFPVEIGSVRRVVQTVTVPHHLDWIECEVRLEGKQPTALVEQGNIAFPFGVTDGRTRLELLGSVVDPETDLQDAGNRDCYAVQSWVDVSGPTGGVTWCPIDTTIVTLGDFQLFHWDSAYRPANTRVYANALNNGWSTNFQEWQSGDFRFRFRFRSHRGSSWLTGGAPRFGRETLQPLLATRVPGGAAGRQQGPARASLLRADAASTVLVNFKRAENGDGHILRFLNPANAADTVRVSLPGVPIASAERVLANEQPSPTTEGAIEVKSGAFELRVGPFGLETVRVRHRSPQNPSRELQSQSGIGIGDLKLIGER